MVLATRDGRTLTLQYICFPTNLKTEVQILHIYELLLFSCSVVSDTLRPQGLQHTRLLCPSPSPGACSNSCPLSWCYHPIISSSVVPSFFCLQSFLGSFPVSQFLASGGQSIGASASASVPPMTAICGFYKPCSSL